MTIERDTTGPSWKKDASTLSTSTRVLTPVFNEKIDVSEATACDTNIRYALDGGRPQNPWLCSYEFDNTEDSDTLTVTLSENLVNRLDDAKRLWVADTGTSIADLSGNQMPDVRGVLHLSNSLT